MCAIAFCFAASWFSGRNKITVATELTSYRWAALLLLFGAGNLLQYKNLLLIVRWSIVCFSIVICVIGWICSDRSFFYWKFRFVPTTSWAEMKADLDNERIEIKANDNTNSTTIADLALSFHRLGLLHDYLGSSSQTVSYEDYAGRLANVTFGNKSRIWGLYEGPVQRLNSFCPECRRIRVGDNLYFFVGTKD